MIKCNTRLLPLLLVCFHNTVIAGGPLATSTNDAAIVYPNGGSSITVNYDLGSLGSRSNSETAALLNQARGIWNNIATSTVNIVQGNNISTNITESNFVSQTKNTNENLIIFDSNGEITEDIFGEHQQGYVTSFNLSSNDGTHITKSHIVLNGHVTNNKTDDELVIAMTQALGHMIGLDHTQLDESQGLASGNEPMMYPLLHRNTPSLHEDDIISASTLYPAANNFGTLSGSFTQANGTAILGANIWVRDTSTNKVYSTISDYYKNNNGDFTLLLPPGTYTVHAESIHSNFYASYRVGPYSQNPADISFQSPHRLNPIAYGQPYPINHDDDDHKNEGDHHHSSIPTPPPVPAVQITITTGNTRHINFNLSGVIPDSDNDDDIDGVNDIFDNCPLIYNADQADFDLDAQGNICDSDDDNDGLSDTYEIANDLDSLDATGINDASGDADGDGFTNIEEFISGSNPSPVTGATSNPGFFNFSTNAVTVNENAGTGEIHVTRTGGSVGNVSVYCFSTDIDAIAETDYATVSETLEWIDGDAADKTCSFTIIDDADIENDETFQLDLSNPSGGAKLGAP